ncbi:MAG: hypothetical protein Q9168_000496 [Polycauliona sp. 1 TL-2023]
MSRRPDSRNIDAGMAKMAIDSSKGSSSKMMSMFERQGTSNSNLSKAQPIDENDGFTKVPPRKTKAPPSAAAQSRANTPAKPHYKTDIPAETRLSGKSLHKDQFRPGMIILAYLHEQDFEATSSKSNITVNQNKHRTPSNFGTIFTKHRRMIIIAKYEDHYIAIPIFTHNGNGLDRKNKPDEYVSVKDHRVDDDTPPESKHPSLETQSMVQGSD